MLIFVEGIVWGTSVSFLKHDHWIQVDCYFDLVYKGLISCHWNPHIKQVLEVDSSPFSYGFLWKYEPPFSPSVHANLKFCFCALSAYVSIKLFKVRDTKFHLTDHFPPLLKSYPDIHHAKTTFNLQTLHRWHRRTRHSKFRKSLCIPTTITITNQTNSEQVFCTQSYSVPEFFVGIFFLKDVRILKSSSIYTRPLDRPVVFRT